MDVAVNQTGQHCPSARVQNSCRWTNQPRDVRIISDCGNSVSANRDRSRSGKLRVQRDDVRIGDDKIRRLRAAKDWESNRAYKNSENSWPHEPTLAARFYSGKPAKSAARP